MNEHSRKTACPAGEGIQSESGRPHLCFYPVLTLGLVLFTAASALMLLGRFQKKDPERATPLNESNPVHAAPSASASDRSPKEFHSQRRTIIQGKAEENGRRAATETDAIRHLDNVLAQAGSRERQTALALKRFAASGAMSELRAIKREDVAALANYLSTELSPVEAGDLLHRFLGLPVESIHTTDDVRSAVVGIFDAVAGNRTEKVRPSVLMVTDRAETDGRITGQVHMLPAGTERVYAVFENARVLSGLDHVLAVWRNPSDDRMVFTEFEPIREGSAYNYVWLDVGTGWPPGRYQVELFDPEAQSLLLASETFSVR